MVENSRPRHVSVIRSSCGVLAGASAASAYVPHHARISPPSKPPRPPGACSRRARGPMMRGRDAPSARRTAESRCRASTRTRKSPMILAHAMAKTMAPVPESASRMGRVLPRTKVVSGVTALDTCSELGSPCARSNCWTSGSSSRCARAASTPGRRRPTT